MELRFELRRAWDCEEEVQRAKIQGYRSVVQGYMFDTTIIKGQGMDENKRRNRIDECTNRSSSELSASERLRDSWEEDQAIRARLPPSVPSYRASRQ